MGADGPFRSWLFAPGNHSRRVEKALSLDADVVILDLEDAVAVVRDWKQGGTFQDDVSLLKIFREK